MSHFADEIKIKVAVNQDLENIIIFIYA